VEYGTVSMFTLTTVWVLFCIDLINSNIVKYYYNFLYILKLNVFL